MKSACEAQWNNGKLAYPLNLAGWKQTADNKGIFKVKGRRLQIINSLLVKQQWMIRKQQTRS